MTCIVAGAGWMAADRRISEGGGAYSSLVKIAKNKWLIAAASGTGTSSLDVRLAVRMGAQTPEDLIEHVDKDSSALVLLAGGIVHVVSEGRVWPATKGLQAIGSGGDLALGYLQAAGEARAMVRAAFKFVASRRADCGGGVDIRSFP